MIERDIQVSFPHRVIFTRDAFSPSNRTLRELLGRGCGDGEPLAKLLVFADESVCDAAPVLEADVQRYCAANDDMLDLVCPVIRVPGGEACKNDWRLVERIWQAINDRQIDRHSYVIAVGGGAVLDLVGFAASTAHRGIRHVRMPTTTLSQGDGGVGVKNGVNYFGKKNWIGTFTVPFGVINDVAFLDLLPEHEKRAGIIEAIKVASIKDRAFFEKMERAAAALGRCESSILARVIERSAELHVDHIAGGGDPFEFGSARPLDFGHWVAHKLEQVSGFTIGHGDAVAIGMAVDVRYGVEVGLTAPDSADRILALMEAAGFDLYSPKLEEADSAGKPVILQGLEEFREHLGGELTVTLVPEIGKKVDVHQMDETAVVAAMRWLRERTAAEAASQ